MTGDTLSDVGFQSASGYDLAGACLDADEIVVNNELITVRAVEDYFSKVTLQQNPAADRPEGKAEAESTDRTPEEMTQLVESKMAPGDPGAELKDGGGRSKDVSRPTSFPSSLVNANDELVASKQVDKGRH